MSFQRTTGYCEQNDVHEPTSTVLESLLFSARLRQSYNTPDEEKVRYVYSIMELLELMPLQHAIVGSALLLTSLHLKLETITNKAQALVLVCRLNSARD